MSPKESLIFRTPTEFDVFEPAPRLVVAYVLIMRGKFLTEPFQKAEKTKKYGVL